MHYLDELKTIIEEENPSSFGDTIKIAQSRGWHLDTSGSNDSHIEKMSAWKGYMQFIAISELIERRSIKETSNSIQYIASGSIMKFEAKLDQAVCKKLEAISNNHHQNVGCKPLTLMKAEEMYGLKDWKELTRSLIDSISQQLIDHTLPETYRDLNIFAPRCLLRRTYPMESIEQLNSNINNQDWHQDSSLNYGSRPMVTLWIPLQSDSGTIRPGLEWSELPLNYFSWRHGDGSSIANTELARKTIGPNKTHEICSGMGSIIGFNGLTLHRTLTHEKMKSHRDALLIRFGCTSYAKYFPRDRDTDFTIQLKD